MSSKESIQTTTKVLRQLLEETGFSEKVQIKKTTNISFINKQYNQTVTFKPANRLSLDEKDNNQTFEKLKKARMETLIQKGQDDVVKRLNFFHFQLSQDVGQLMLPINDIEKTSFNDKGEEIICDADFKVTHGIVTLVDFWATWCSPCQEPMAHNEKMLKENEQNWKGKVEIVGISLDDSSPPHLKRIKEKDWKRVTHYRIKNGWDYHSEELDSLNIKGIPFIVLVGQSGKIVFKGHPKDCNLEEKINELLSSQQISGNIVQEVIEQIEEKQTEKNSYKKGKKFMKEAWKDHVNTQDKINGQFNLMQEKSYLFNSKGVKQSKKYGKVVVEYKVLKEQKEWALTGVQLIQDNIPADGYLFKKEIISDPEFNTQQHLKFLYNLLESNNIEPQICLQKRIDVNYYSNSFRQFENSHYYLKKVDNIDLVNKIKPLLSKYIEENQENNIGPFQQFFKSVTSSKLSLQSKFVTIEDLHQYQKTEVLSIEHKQGQVLVIDFWSYTCSNSINGIIEKISLLNKRDADWKDKVRFIAISLSKESKCQGLLQIQHKWLDKIEFLFMRQGKQSKVLEIYGVQTSPYCVIVGKDGIVNTLGQCRNIEETIDKLLSEENNLQSNSQIQQKNEIPSQDQIVKFYNFMNDQNVWETFRNKLINLVSETFLFEFTLIQLRDVSLDDQSTQNWTIESITLFIWVRENNYPQIEEFINQIYLIIPKEYVTVNLEIMKTHNIPLANGQQCLLCETQLSDETPYYWSFHTKKFYCAPCAEFEDQEKKGNARFKVVDTLAYINAPLNDKNVLKDIDEYKFGKNFKINDNEEGNQQHQMICNGCEDVKAGPRYIALSLKLGYPKEYGYCDLCARCFGIWKNKGSNESKNLIEKNKYEDYSDDIIWLRVLFSFGYFIF